MRSTRVPASRSLRAGGVALIAAAALTGCQWTSTIQTDQAYEPADGTSVRVGGLEVNNVIVVSEGKGAPGNVTGLAINNTARPLEVRVRVANAGGEEGPAIAVPAGGTAALSAPGGQAVTIPSVSEIAGSHIALTISSSEGQTSVSAPILPPVDFYAPYAPGAGTGTAGATVTEGTDGTASPTEPTAPATEPAGSPADQTEPAEPTATTAAP